MSLRPALLALAAGAVLGCTGATRGPDFPTSESFADAARHPPSFASELAAGAGKSDAPDAPDGELDASRPREAVVPLDPEAARDVVSRFFMAVLVESSHDLFPLFAAQAWIVGDGGRQPAQNAWRARLAQLDYGSLSGRLVATPQSLRTYTFDSLAQARRDSVPPPQTPQEVVVVARPGVSWAGKARLFGDALAFRLRPKRDGSGYEIAEIAEDFRLP